MNVPNHRLQMTKKIQITNTRTGEVRMFKHAGSAASYLGVSPGTIRSWAKGRTLSPGLRADWIHGSMASLQDMVVQYADPVLAQEAQGPLQEARERAEARRARYGTPEARLAPEELLRARQRNARAATRKRKIEIHVRHESGSVQVFESIKAAAAHVGVSHSWLAMATRGGSASFGKFSLSRRR